MVHACVLSTGEVETGVSLGLLASSSKSVGEPQASERLCLKSQHGEQKTQADIWPHGNMYIHVCIHMNTLKQNKTKATIWAPTPKQTLRNLSLVTNLSHQTWHLTPSDSLR